MKCGIGKRGSPMKWSALTVAALVVSLGVSVPAFAAASTKGIAGSTLSQWKKTRAVWYGTGCTRKYPCFGAPVHNKEAGRTYQFRSLYVDGGVVDGWSQAFVDNTSISAAKKAVMAMMPSDAVAGPIEVDHNGGSCAFMSITSSTLGKVLGRPKIGDPQGILSVDFSHFDSSGSIVYNPSNVEDATVSLGPANLADSC